MSGSNSSIALSMKRHAHCGLP